MGASPADHLLDRAVEALVGLGPRDLASQNAIPALAKIPEAARRIAEMSRGLPTRHRLVRGDARDIAGVREESVHLIVTSPPYWTLKRYRQVEGQLGNVADYDTFLDGLGRVWAECFRVLVPGGRLVVVVGDVCLSRRTAGRHAVIPLHATIQERCRTLGFDNLAPIIWHKIANAKYEVQNGGSGFLGKPYEPNGIIKNDIEFILMQRKGGGYRKPTLGMRLLSMIPEVEHKEWFQQIWRITGASTRDHPAPFPLALAERLIRMFSFVGDTVLDPFVGTGTTCVAAANWGRHSIGFDIDPQYLRLARARFAEILSDMFRSVTVAVEDADGPPSYPVPGTLAGRVAEAQPGWQTPVRARAKVRSGRPAVRRRRS
jgi:DNA modification methylase